MKPRDLLMVIDRADFEDFVYFGVSFDTSVKYSSD